MPDDVEPRPPYDYADQIVERLFPFDGSDPQTVIEARRRAAQGVREGYALAFGVNS